MTRDADVLKAHFIDTLAERADAGDEHFAAQEVDFRMSLRDGGRRFAHAAADFKNQRRFAAEGGLVVKGFGLVLDFVFREDFLESALLGDGNVAAAQHETADMTVLELLELFRCEFFAGHAEKRRTVDSQNGPLSKAVRFVESWSGRRESNPRIKLGKLSFCH